MERQDAKPAKNAKQEHLSGPNNPPDRLTQRVHVEIEEQPELKLARPQIREDLRRVKKSQLFDGFQLDNEPLGHEQIETRLRDEDTLVVDRERHLALKRNTPLRELDGHRLLVDVLEETWAELSVNLDGRADDRMC